jgi:hypothetical protein
MGDEAIRLMQPVVDGVLDREGALGLFALDGDGNVPSQDLIKQRARDLLESEAYMHSGVTDLQVRRY